MINPFWLLYFVVKSRKARRSTEGFCDLLREKPDTTAYFLQNTRQSGAYPEGPDGGWRYDFSRQPKHDELLARYHLDEVAGEGDTFERALRVMDWQAKHSWYIGAAIWYAWQRDSVKILRWAYDKPISHCINCMQQGIALADCLMAAGIYAMPVCFWNFDYKPAGKKIKTMPNHTTTHVWLPEERRWVNLDPSMNSYLTDEAGRALNLVEIHERHRAGQPLIIAQYDLNGTQLFREEYLSKFFLPGVLELVATLDGKTLLSPEDVPRKDGKRYLTTAELLAEPHI